MLDKRWTPAYVPVIAMSPWAVVRTALVALPLAVVRRHGLEFDEGFVGWGPEDLRELNRVALDAAFCDEGTKDRIRKRLEAA